VVKVFVAGAGGVVGRHLIPQLIGAGHEVVAMTRSPGKTSRLRELGAQPVLADALTSRR
jgi:2-alkyl-3-oxoalkanoate reductase